ncbi:hypothetical protein LSH36_875g00012 [Paralvinella palmiformis]|uniref:Glycosyltransferase family 92 protein n=1 Tax=Paralvinella palmiformis TaxID=53620 RepID=A0AAD9IYV1_9ANNE|nr:hypothetical protein LSH36_875g00012 [Paralvinella palmiformis]
MIDVRIVLIIKIILVSRVSADIRPSLYLGNSGSSSGFVDPTRLIDRSIDCSQLFIFDTSRIWDLWPRGDFPVMRLSVKMSRLRRRLPSSTFITVVTLFVLQVGVPYFTYILSRMTSTEIESRLFCQRGAYVKMIMTRCDVCFTGDISVLWASHESLSHNQMIANLESRSRRSEKFTSDGVMLLNLERTSSLLLSLKTRCHDATLLFTKDNTNDNDTSALIAGMCRTPSGEWERNYEKQSYDIPLIRVDMFMPVYINTASSHVSDYDVITHIERYNGDTFRQITPFCVEQERPAVISNVCDVYPAIATMPRRTHTHFISNARDNATDSTTGVTLITQLMFNRIDNLERLLQSWKGPSQVTLYLTDEEVISFKDFYQQSDVLKQADATYHVVFKRHDDSHDYKLPPAGNVTSYGTTSTMFYPINYARNVAIRETKTPFYVMIDVDFAAQPSLYQNIMSYIKQLKPNEKKVFIIPVFETQYKHYRLPKTKEQLLKDLEAHLLIAYHQVAKGWTKGHERTNYEKWKTSEVPYEVRWEFGYEPYVVVPTSEFIYDETLVERMRDKLTYTVNIVIKRCAKFVYDNRIQDMIYKFKYRYEGRVGESLLVNFFSP